MIGFMTPSPALAFADDFASLSLRNAVNTGRVNQVRNAALWGAGVGPVATTIGPKLDGSTPENWHFFSSQSLTLTVFAVGTATVDGVTVQTVTFRLSGTAPGGGEVYIHPEHQDALRTAAAQAWTLSGYARSETGGTGTTNITWMEMLADAYSDAAVAAGSTTAGVMPLQATLTRVSASFTTGAGANYARCAWRIFHNAGAIDFRFTLAAPQYEKAASVSALDYRSTEASGTWNTDYFNGQTPGGGEEQYYVNVALDGTRHSGGVNPFSVASSTLSITGTPVASGTVFGRSFTSGILTTRGSFEFNHGYIEARIKMPAGAGWWPALWGLPRVLTGSGLPEIDFLEFWANDATTLQGNLHSYSTGSQVTQWSYHTVSNLSADYHLYGCDWRAGAVTWYFDRTPFTGITSGRPATTPTDVEAASIYVLLNLAMGGGGHGTFNNTGQAPGSMLIDYVRVWDRLPF